MNKDLHYLQQELYELVQKDHSVFEFIQRGSLDGIWYWDLKKPEHEWMSPQFWETLGYDPAQMQHLASEWQDLIHPDDLQVALDNFHKHSADPQHPYDQIVRYRHRDGSTVWVRCRGIAIRDDQGKPIRMLGAHTDITSQKKAEQALRSSERFLSAMFESIQDGIMVLAPDLSILRVNKGVKEFYPQVSEFEGMKCYEVCRGRSEPCEVCPAGRSFQTKKFETAEIELTKEDGAPSFLEVFAFPMIDDAGNATAVIEFIRDITCRKTAETAVSESETKYRTLFESSTDSLFIIDAETGRYLDCNNAGVRIFAMSSREDIIGSAPYIFSPEQQADGTPSRELAMLQIKKAYAEGSNEFEWIHTKRDGTVFPVRVTLSAMVLGERQLVLAVCRDLTEIKNAEAKREQLIKNLKDAVEQIKTLHGILPMCSYCKKIRNDQGYWEQLEAYLTYHTEAKLSHGMCPDCLQREFPDLMADLKEKEER